MAICYSSNKKPNSCKKKKPVKCGREMVKHISVINQLVICCSDEGCRPWSQMAYRIKFQLQHWLVTLGKSLSLSFFICIMGVMIVLTIAYDYKVLEQCLACGNFCKIINWLFSLNGLNFNPGASKLRACFA